MRVAAVDIGTNTVRLLIAGPEGDLVRRSEVVGLGFGLQATGRLAPDAMDRALAALASFGAVLREYRVERVRAVATAACRRADNADRFLDRVTRLIGVRPEVIPGEVEAGLSFRGAVEALGDPVATMVIDVGGGSTEFVFGTSDVFGAVSIGVGSVVLTEAHFSTLPPSEVAMTTVRNHLRRELASVPGLGIPQRVVGVAGTFTSLAAIHLELSTYNPNRIDRAVLSITDLDHLVERLSRLTVAETAAIPGVEPKRAPVLLAGALIATEGVRCTGLDRVIISEHDLLDGVVAELT